MTQKTTHKEILSLWPSLSAIAADCGNRYDMVKMWNYRGRIPDDWYVHLIDSAKKHGIDLTYKDLCEASSRRKWRYK